jgi:hypothetical protein
MKERMDARSIWVCTININPVDSKDRQVGVSRFSWTPLIFSMILAIRAPFRVVVHAFSEKQHPRQVRNGLETQGTRG